MKLCFLKRNLQIPLSKRSSQEAKALESFLSCVGRSGGDHVDRDVV